MIKRLTIFAVIVLFCVGCSTMRHTNKDKWNVTFWVIPFDNQYYAGIRMSTIKNHPDAKISTFSDVIFYRKLNDFIDHIDTCRIDSLFLVNKDPFVSVLLQVKRGVNDSPVQIGLNQVGMFVYRNVTYYTNDSLINLIQPYIKEKFRKRHFPDNKK